MKSLTKYTLGLALLVALTACGGGDGSSNSGDNSGNYSVKPVPGLGAPQDGQYFLGYVFFEQENSQAQSGLNVSANFFSTATAPRIGMIAQDECLTVTSPAIVLDATSGSERISGGEQVIVATPASTYATLTDRFGIVGNYSEYFPDALPVPNSFNVSIQGEEFPAISEIDIPNLQPFELLQPTRSDPVTLNTVFRWTPDSEQNSHIELYLFGATNITCHIRDDGEFALPQSLVAKLDGDLDFTLGNLGRFKKEIRVFGAASVSVLHSSYINLFDIPN